MKKVSVIIPAYKVESYLPQCLDSVITQSYKDLEIIVVDDASPDKCGIIADEYTKRDSRIKVIHNLKNRGLSVSRNVAIESATGEYIFFLDSDDWLRHNTISRLVAKAQQGVLCVCGYDLEIMPSGEITQQPQAYGSITSLSAWLDCFPSLFATKFNFAWGKLYDAAIIKHNDMKFKEDLSLVEDILFNLQYYRHCTGFYLDDYNGYIYRQTGSTSLSKKFDPRMIEWNVTSFTLLVEFLKSYNKYSPANKAHLMANACSNFKYNFRLVVQSSQYNWSTKVRIINEALSKHFVFESICSGCSTSISYQGFLSFLLRHKMIGTYLFIESVRNILR